MNQKARTETQILGPTSSDVLVGCRKISIFFFSDNFNRNIYIKILFTSQNKTEYSAFGARDISMFIGR